MTAGRLLNMGPGRMIDSRSEIKAVDNDDYRHQEEPAL